MPKMSASSMAGACRRLRDRPSGDGDGERGDDAWREVAHARAARLRGDERRGHVVSLKFGHVRAA